MNEKLVRYIMKRHIWGLCPLIILLWSHSVHAAPAPFGARPPDASVQRGGDPRPGMPPGVAGARYMKAGGVSMQAAQAGPDGWRLRVREATTAPSRMVTLGDIADPIGAIAPGEWRRLAAQELWPAPDEAGKPMQINKARLAAALREVLGTLADQCILPNSLVIQRGGAVLREEELHALLVKNLTEPLRALPGTAELQDVRLPPYIFLAHPQQQVALEPVKLAPGRLSLRFVVQEMDGAALRRVAATAFLNVWMETPCAAKPLNRGDPLTPDAVTYIRMNAAHMRELPWDGRGGPWQVQRAIAVNQPILQGDLLTQSMLRKGNIVNLVYEKGNVRMSVRAEVLADGEPGGTVPVRNLQSNKQVFATVRDSGTVVVK
ncbi:MAG: flagellar basal body P-ring formation chaperone FlgA [Deltaproteobacteria bacterium]|jgi:flagella basal body P-ring formation protein FlgA|nr:flagellar basal body P-ring formation chaperone FlgA [Deltaproteobacteria bacterium]